MRGRTPVHKPRENETKVRGRRGRASLHSGSTDFHTLPFGVLVGEAFSNLTPLRIANPPIPPRAAAKARMPSEGRLVEVIINVAKKGKTRRRTLPTEPFTPMALRRTEERRF